MGRRDELNERGSGELCRRAVNLTTPLGDRGYDADWFRDALQAKGITPCIPGRKSRTEPVRYDKRRYKRRNRIKIMFGNRPQVVQTVQSAHSLTFDDVQAQLATRTVRKRSRRNGQGDLAPALLSLKGRLFDCDGGAMTPSHAYGRRGGAHRYYISSRLNRGKATKRPDGIYRLPALPAERWVIETLHRLAPDYDPLEILARMEVYESAVHLALKASVLAEDDRTLALTVDRICRLLQEGERIHSKGERVWVHLPRRLTFRGGRVWLSGEGPKHSRMNPPLIKAVKRAHALLDVHADAGHVLVEAPPTVHERGLIRLAWLAPDLQAAILEGRQKTGLCLEDLRFNPIPLCWDDQRRMLGA